MFYNVDRLKKISEGVFEYDGTNTFAATFGPNYFEDETAFKEGDTITIKTLEPFPVGTPQPEDEMGEPLHAGVDVVLIRVFVLKPDGVTLTMRDKE